MEDFFSCIWFPRVLKFSYSTCGYVAFGRLRQVCAVVAVEVCVSADKCIRALFLEARRCWLPGRRKCLRLRSSFSVGTEARTLPGPITRRHTWEMNDCRRPDRVVGAEESEQAQRVWRLACADGGSPVRSTTAEHSWRSARAALSQGGLWFAVDVSPNTSVNTWANARSGRVRKGGANRKSRA